MVDEAKTDIEETVETQEESAAKQEEAGKTLEERMDAVLDEAEGKEKPSESSSDSKEKPEGKETEKEAEATGDPDLEKKEAEADKETKIPEEFHKHEAWKRIKESEEKALKELEELKKGGVLSDEDKSLLDNVKQFTSSRQYLEDKYKSEGFKDDVVKEKLAEAGFDVSSDESDLEVAAKALNLDVASLSDQDKSDISNLVKISNALVQNTLNKVLPKVMQPISDQVAGLTSKDSGLKLHDDFVSKVKEDGILDFTKDIAPDINQYLDDNPKTTQDELAKFMQESYHEKLVLYKKAAEKKGERADKLKDNRPGGEGSRIAGEVPDKTGDFNKDADAILDHVGYNG